jgi:hypothetical protein
MSDSKVRLSEEEMQLVQNSGWILTKHGIIDKVYHMFGGLAGAMQQSLPLHHHEWPAKVLESTPKISKGEQYERMPYVVLDYPRVFSKEDVLAVRTFFWWGNYFSCTLHLKGKYAKLYYENIQGMLQDEEEYYLSVQGNEFNFDLGHEDYTAIKKGGIPDIPYTAPFIKISYKSSFAYWDTTSERLLEAFQKFMSVLAR